MLALALATVLGCESPTGNDDRASQTIVPPQGRRGVGIPVLSPIEIAEVFMSTEVIPVDPGDYDGKPTALSSAPDGTTIMLGGTFVDTADDCETRVPGTWTAVDGWVRIPTATDNGTTYDINAIGDGGHLIGERSNCKYWGSVYWSSASTPELFLGPSYRLGGLNSAGEVAGYIADGPFSEAVVGSPDGSGGLTWRNLHRELLVGLGYGVSQGVDINDRGQVLVMATEGDSFDVLDFQVLLIDGDVVHDLSNGLGDALGGEGFVARAMNNADPVQIVGQSNAGDDDPALLWTFFSEDSIVVEVLDGPPGYDGPPVGVSDIDDAGNILGDMGGSPIFGQSETILWVASGETLGVARVGPNCENARPQIDHSAHLAGVARVLTCGHLYEIQLN